MKRAILVPRVLSPGALDELKNWLAISTTQDDPALLALLGSAIDMCEAFTRIMPLEATCEEVLAATRDWQCLATLPVQAITAVDGLRPDGTRQCRPFTRPWPASGPHSYRSTVMPWW